MRSWNVVTTLKINLSAKTIEEDKYAGFKSQITDGFLVQLWPVVLLCVHSFPVRGGMAH